MIDELPTLPKEILGVAIPDSELARGASMVMAMAASRSLYNHCLRTYLLGSLHFARLGQKVDAELVFVSSILHDLGLLKEYAGDLTKTFERNGAEFARLFVERGGFKPDQADRVFRGILLHAGQAGNEPENEVRFVMIGAAEDVFGPNAADISDQQLHAIEAAVPRYAFKTAFIDMLNEHVARSQNPDWTGSFVHPDDPWNVQFRGSRWSE